MSDADIMFPQFDLDSAYQGGIAIFVALAPWPPSASCTVSRPTLFTLAENT